MSVRDARTLQTTTRKPDISRALLFYAAVESSRHGNWSLYEQTHMKFVKVR